MREDVLYCSARKMSADGGRDDAKGWAFCDVGGMLASPGNTAASGRRANRPSVFFYAPLAALRVFHTCAFSIFTRMSTYAIMVSLSLMY